MQGRLLLLLLLLLSLLCICFDFRNDPDKPASLTLHFHNHNNAVARKVVSLLQDRGDRRGGLCFAPWSHSDRPVAAHPHAEALSQARWLLLCKKPCSGTSHC